METTSVTTTPFFKWTEQDAADANAYPSLREGTFEFGITEVKAGVHEETNNCTLDLVLAPLNANGAPDRELQVRDSVTITLANPNIPGHKLTSPTDKLSLSTFKRMHNTKAEKYVRAIEPGYLPSEISWDKQERCFRDESGTVLAKEVAEAYKVNVTNLVWAKLGEWYVDPSLVKGAKVFGTIKKKGQYTNIDKIMANSGDNEVIREDFAV